MSKKKFLKNSARTSACLIVLLLLICQLAVGCRPTGVGSETSVPESSSKVTPEASTDAATLESPITSGEISTEEETSVPVPDTTEEPKPIFDAVVGFAACGDNILYRPAIREAADRAVAGGRKHNFRPIYKNVESIISGADLAFINQETVMAGEAYGYSGYPQFNSPEDIADDLVDIGFDIVSIANNHILDMGEKGLANTLEKWNSLPVVTVGAYKDAADAANIRVIERNGVKIAVLAYTYSSNGYRLGTNSPLVVSYYRDPFRNSPTYGMIYEDKLRSEVAAAREVADVVLVSIHWGYEYTQKVNEEQKQVAQLLCDSGADIILGHHPHILQSIEFLKSSDGSRRTMCAYSLGNFYAMQGDDYNALGGILTFDIHVVDKSVNVENILFTPTVSYFNYSYRNNEIYLLSDFTAELCSSHCVVRRGGDGTFGGVMSLSTLRYYLNNVISDEYLPERFRKNS